jgi:HK97 family phage prohead protease
MNILDRSEFVGRLTAGEGADVIFPDRESCAQKLLVDVDQSIGKISDANSTIDDVILSNETVDRYGDTIKASGWDLAAYRRNPVLQWAHDSSIPAIGRVTNLRTTSRDLRSSLVFAPRDVYPLADTIFNLVKGKFLSAVSVGFAPIKAAPSKARPGGIDFFEQELLELSVCNVPANPDCLVQARSAGVNTAPLVTWAELVLDTGGLQMIPRDELQALRRAAGAPSVFASAQIEEEIAVRRRRAHALKLQIECGL